MLSLKKYKWAQSQVKFCGQIVGSGKRFAGRGKIKVVDEMENPKTKTELRRILGFLTFFRKHIGGFAEIAKPLTDLTSKKVPAKIPWEQKTSNGV